MIKYNRRGSVKEKEENYDLVRVVMLCLGNPREEENAEIVRLLSVLFSSEQSAEEKKNILGQDFAIPMTREVEERMVQMCNLSDGVEQKGIEKGREAERTSMILNALKNATVEQVKTILGVTDEEIRMARMSLKEKSE